MKDPQMFKKVPITTLLEIITHLYEDGVDYIDIEKDNIVDEKADRIKIKVLPEYYMDEEKNDDDNEDIETDQKSSLFDLDINDLI